MNRAVDYADQRNHPKIVVEPGVDNQGLKGGVRISLRSRHLLYQLFQKVIHPKTCLGTDLEGLIRRHTNDLLDLGADPLGLR